jgi:NAD(P)-dependent dehydrogenase (short-subunit alcohol dehydrogenase family)
VLETLVELGCDMSPQERLFRFQPAPDSLAQQIVVITGASRGIGSAVSRAAAAAGAQTVLLARGAKQMETIADDIVKAGHIEPGIVPVNLEGATVDDYTKIAGLISERYGRVDSLVLNAGMLGEMAPLATYDPISWARVFQTNVHSQFLLLQALLPLLDLSDNGSIIFTSSGVGRKARAFWGAYAASKFATEGMMQILADELAERGKVRVNSLNPGRVRTQMRAQAYPAEDPASLPRAEDITDAYLFLLCSDSADVHDCALDAQASTPSARTK